MAVYYGLGSKASIMANRYTALQNVVGQKYVDYQRSYDSGIGPEKMPGFFLNDLREDKKLLLADVVKNTLTLGVVGWVRAGVGESLWTVLNSWYEAAKTALVADPSCGNQAYSFEIATYETDAGSRYPVGVFVMIINVVYFSAK